MAPERGSVAPQVRRAIQYLDGAVDFIDSAPARTARGGFRSGVLSAAAGSNALGGEVLDGDSLIAMRAPGGARLAPRVAALPDDADDLHALDGRRLAQVLDAF